jgi:transcriptional regulator with XRE-family HTH domain
MNAILGARIKSLRESKGLTQEQIAHKLDWTRQKYARLEKGLLDISYASITAIAQILGVKPDEITSSVGSICKEELMFRNSDGSVCEDKFEYINKMLDVFYAHRKLYNSVRRVDLDE